MFIFQVDKLSKVSLAMRLALTESGDNKGVNWLNNAVKTAILFLIGWSWWSQRFDLLTDGE
jgi:hypothetical protein